MKKILLFNILVLLFNTCDEPQEIICYEGTSLDECGVCCGGNSNIECSTGPETGAMDICGVCFGNNTQCVGCTDPDAYNYDIYATINNSSCIYDGEFWHLDVGFLIESNWCINSNNDGLLNTQCNNYSNNEQECTEQSLEEYNCEWIGIFEGKVGWPIYWLNSSSEDITIEIIETINPQCGPIYNFLNEPIVNDISECLLASNNEQDCEIYNPGVCENILNGIGNCLQYNNESTCDSDSNCEWEPTYSQNPCQWVTTDWYDFSQEIQTIPSNTILSSEAQIFNGFSEATEKMYQSEINGELKFGKIIITE